ncbi:MAG: hypothetical protein A4E65_02388 [Syntrophorhabdus sp. PtaU1.Bin153]|nr:MAG: hypothetical protein A4E65_02388 [Syntrophorhabdus sp. PtaU1.Bin153]
MQNETAVQDSKAIHNEDNYEDFLRRIQQAYFDMTLACDSHLFTTEVDNLFQTFLEALPSHKKEKIDIVGQ